MTIYDFLLAFCSITAPLSYLLSHLEYNVTVYETAHMTISQAVNVYYRIGSKKIKTRMWANAQRDGRLAEHRWRPLFNAAKFG